MAAAEPTSRSAVDAGELWSFLAQPWRLLQRVPPLVWLAPLPAVRVLQADGSETLWLGDRRQEASARQRETAPFVAVEVPREEHLELPVSLPPMPAADRQDALAMELRMASPFDAADLVWGWREAPQGAAAAPLTAVLASRQAVQARLAQVADKLGPRKVPEVWAFATNGLPVVLQGFGEAARQRQAARGRWQVWLLLLLALLLAAAVAVTPTVQLKLRAMQAVRALAALEQDLGPVLAQREALVKAQGQRDELRELMAERVEPLAVLDLVTQAVPDDTWVQRLQLQGSKLTLSGPTPNTAALMNRFSGLPQVRDVRAPVAATRTQSGRENFTIELTVLPEALRPTLQGPTMSPVTEARPAAAPAVPAVPPAAAVAAPAAPASTALPASAAASAATGAKAAASVPAASPPVAAKAGKIDKAAPASAPETPMFTSAPRVK